MSCRTGDVRFTNKSQANSYSCFSNDSLIRIARTLNSTKTIIPDKLIHDLESKHSPKLRKEMIKHIRQAFRPICDSGLPHHQDSCIVQTGLVDLGEDKFAVPIPAPNNELLIGKPWSTSEVEAAMSYIEKKFPHFMFLEPAPMDFDTRDERGECLVSELCHFDLTDIIKKHKRSFGLLFNTHPSYKPGGHWICLFACLYSGRVCFYDSYGFLPEKEIVRFMKRIQQQYTSLFNKPMEIIYNDYQNQKDGVECGTFCIMFISEMARHGNMEKAIKYIRDDDRVRDLRTDIFTYNYNKA